MSQLLEIKNLSVDIMSTRGLIHAVRQVNLDIEQGIIHGIVGESGCGKSVTAKSVMRLHHPRTVRIRGEIKFNGVNLLSLSEREMQRIRGREISMIFQDPMSALNPLFCVGDQIAEVFMHHFKDSRAAAKKKALELLEQVGIHPAQTRYQQYPFEFSGGMLQRVVIAIAVAAKPKLIIADEPTTALDVTIQAQVLELLKQLQKELNVSIMIITHNFGIVAELCDHVSVMYAGTVLETGRKRDMFRHAVNPYSRALIESIPKTGHAGQRLTTIPGTPPELFDLVDGCPFAPRCDFASDICWREKPLLAPCAGMQAPQGRLEAEGESPSGLPEGAHSAVEIGHLAACHNCCCGKEAQG